MKGFSFASVILSYFLIAGGLLSGLLLLGYIKPGTEVVGYLCFAAGSFAGGFVAARASAGSTIIEPAIGALLVIGTFAGMVAGTDMGKYLWHAAPDGTAKFVAAMAGSTAIGGLAGAWISEKFFGDSTLSSVPWIAYIGFATFGASFITLAIGAIAIGAGEAPDKTVAKMMIVGMGVGCLLAGLASGALARTRPLLASIVGGGAGVAGFLLLATQNAPHDKDLAAGIAVFGVGGAIVTVIGTAIGWAVIGKKNA